MHIPPSSCPLTSFLTHTGPLNSLLVLRISKFDPRHLYVASPFPPPAPFAALKPASQWKGNHSVPPSLLPPSLMYRTHNFFLFTSRRPTPAGMHLGAYHHTRPARPPPPAHEQPRQRTGEHLRARGFRPTKSKRAQTHTHTHTTPLSSRSLVLTGAACARCSDMGG